MTKDRKYQDGEIREILDLAIGHEDAPVPTFPVVDGLTLDQLREVGREVGLSPSRIMQAVAEFEGRGASVPRGTTLGLPTSVGSIVALPRNPSDREWELLIAELRTTFGGKGELTSQGGLREWSHGTVHAFIEPTESGHRLRLADSRLAAVGGIALGGFFLAFALMILIVLLGKDDPGFRFVVPAFFSFIGGGMIAGNVVALPAWAREQERRMEHINIRAARILAPDVSPESPP
jgi:hypothetical protein